MGFHNPGGHGQYMPQNFQNMGYGGGYPFQTLPPQPAQMMMKQHPMNMSMHGQPMSSQFQMPSHIMPPQQNYGYGYPSMQMSMQQTSDFGQNQFYGTQEQPGYSLFGSQYSNMGDPFQQMSSSPLWESTGVPPQHQFHHSQFYPPQQHYGYEPQYQGFGSQDFYPGAGEKVGFNQQDWGYPGDPHPSIFCSNNPPAKVKVKPDTDEQMRTGSWDPKFLQKSGIRKFHHNNGQKYIQGHISNSQNIKKSAGYSKVKKTKKFRNNKKKSHNDNPNIFTQTFGGGIHEDPQVEDPSGQGQVPFLNIGNPPQTAKFSMFNQNLPKSNKSSDKFGHSQQTFKGQPFSETFQMQGPLKSSRLPHNDPMSSDMHGARLKKSKSINDDESMQDQSHQMKAEKCKYRISISNRT